jgi:HEAT repeat protein
MCLPSRPARHRGAYARNSCSALAMPRYNRLPTLVLLISVLGCGNSNAIQTRPQSPPRAISEQTIRSLISDVTAKGLDAPVAIDKLIEIGAPAVPFLLSAASAAPSRHEIYMILIAIGEPAVPFLMGAIERRERYYSQEFVKLLGYIQSDDAVSLLKSLLDEPELKAAASTSLNQVTRSIRYKDIRRRVRQVAYRVAIHSPFHFSVRAADVTDVLQIGRDISPVLREIVSMQPAQPYDYDRLDLQRVLAYRALGRLKEPQDVTLLVQELRRLKFAKFYSNGVDYFPENMIEGQVSTAIVEMGKIAVPPILDYFQTIPEIVWQELDIPITNVSQMGTPARREGWTIQKLAVILGDIGDTSVVPVFRKLLSDAHSSRRAVAITVLALLRDTSALPVITKMVRDDPNDAVRDTARWAIEQIKKPAPK